MAINASRCTCSPGPTVGSEIKKTRPCLVVSPGRTTRNIATVIVRRALNTKGRLPDAAVPAGSRARTARWYRPDPGRRSGHGVKRLEEHTKDAAAPCSRASELFGPEWKKPGIERGRGSSDTLCH